MGDDPIEVTSAESWWDEAADRLLVRINGTVYAFGRQFLLTPGSDEFFYRVERAKRTERVVAQSRDEVARREVMVKEREALVDAKEAEQRGLLERLADIETRLRALEQRPEYVPSSRYR